MKELFDLRCWFQAFREAVSLLIRHRRIIWEMSRRDITDRYAGQVLGTFWAVGHPLILMGVYVLVFSFIFRMKMGGTPELPFDYTTYLLSGIIPWLVFQESMTKAATVVVSHSNLVKQVVFPVEVLPTKGVFSSFLTQIISTAILVLYVVIKHGFLPWTYLLLPVLFLVQIMAMIGVSFFLSSVGTYFRDLKDFTQVFFVVNFYVMPMIFVPNQIPSFLEPIFYINPFSYMTWCYQDICYFGRFEHPLAWIGLSLFSLLSFIMGYRVFRKLKLMFGNVL